MVQSREESGRYFRIFFGFAVVAVGLLLVLAKYDLETNLEMPQIEYGTGFGEVKDTSADLDNNGQPAASAGGAAGSVSEVVGAEMERLYEVLGVKGRLKQPSRRPSSSSSSNSIPRDDVAEGDGEASAKIKKEDPDKERRRENYRVRQELKAAYQKHNDGVGQLVSCGRSCEAKNKQVELAYTALASQIDRPLESVLFDKPDQQKKRSWSAAELKETYARRKKEIEEQEAEGEDRQMAVEELKDAFDILSNHEATTYMRLVGRKPPEYMKHLSQRDGGWGEKLQTGQFKNRLIFAWLDYFNSAWAEVAILGGVAVILLMRLPQAVKQTQQLVDELEWGDEVEKSERLASSPTSPAAATTDE